MADEQQFKAYALTALPTTGIDVNGIYFIKPIGRQTFNAYIRKADNSDWISLGIVNGVDSVNSLIGDVQLNLSLSAAGVLSITGGSTTIDLDARYTKNIDNIAWSRITGRPTTLAGYGITDAVKNVGNETIAGTKNFSSSPVIPNATAANHALAKGQADAAISSIQTQIDNLATAVTEGIKTPTDLNCSTNPNYPASTKGDSYRVIAAGKIGGASGVAVTVGDLIVCKTTSAAGTHAAVGANFYILEGNLDQATETSAGTAKIATTAQVTAGSDDSTIVTPAKLEGKLVTERTNNEGKFVRVDAAQALTDTQKGVARTNIGAAADSAVLHNTGNESADGDKTFTGKLFNDVAVTDDKQVTNRSYVDANIASATAWGSKEW